MFYAAYRKDRRGRSRRWEKSFSQIDECRGFLRERLEEMAADDSQSSEASDQDAPAPQGREHRKDHARVPQAFSRKKGIAFEPCCIRNSHAERSTKEERLLTNIADILHTLSNSKISSVTAVDNCSDRLMSSSDHLILRFDSRMSCLV